MAETFFGVSMIPMNFKGEVRQIKSELLCFLGHPTGTCYSEQVYGHVWDPGIGTGILGGSECGEGTGY